MSGILFRKITYGCLDLDLVKELYFAYTIRPHWMIDVTCKTEVHLDR